MRRNPREKIKITLRLDPLIVEPITQLIQSPLNPERVRFGAWSNLVEALLTDYLIAIRQKAPSISRHAADQVAFLQTPSLEDLLGESKTPQE